MVWGGGNTSHTVYIFLHFIHSIHFMHSLQFIDLINFQAFYTIYVFCTLYALHTNPHKGTGKAIKGKKGRRGISKEIMKRGMVGTSF